MSHYSTHPESRGMGDDRWPDAALRVQGDLLLVCVERDGGGHTRLGRDKSDERRDAFFAGHGWYVARLFTKSWDTTSWRNVPMVISAKVSTAAGAKQQHC